MQGAEFIPEQLRSLVERYWQRLLENSECPESLKALLEQDQTFHEELLRVWTASEFVANQTLSRPGLLLELFARRNETDTGFHERLRLQLESLQELDYQSGAEELKRRLRNFHRLEYLLVIWRDICGLDVHEVCRQMTELADAALQVSLEVLQQWSHREWGQPMAAGQAQSLVVIGMGKLGATS